MSQETAMHPIITLDLMKARASDLHRQAGRDALSLAAHRARQAPTKKTTRFMPAHATAELIRHVLTLPGARRPSQVPDPGGKHQPSALSGPGKPRVRPRAATVHRSSYQR
jgi:hypothetical protein